MGVKQLLTWDVGQHDDDEAVVVVEGHVILVGEPHGVHSRSAHDRQSGINGQQFSDDSQGVQDDEEVISGDGEDAHGHTHVQQTLLQVKFADVKTHTINTCFHALKPCTSNQTQSIQFSSQPFCFLFYFEIPPLVCYILLYFQSLSC